ncbi:dTDP-4-dehydrorhamnose reductase [Brevundimonas subvibrioides]|uniref:dTDP-4-dehydrorhamnose reductase n=1 Tax=Brevundimonas subvibrioides (strain ATCC 15264 / DSM 4735 / LMG 14903 / NBRC 16000 / CB 81) TaxID=633149 RepID=D9QP29_BRESC|nr:dTDP-4-dehydrorhamnose reductase [Brevundimonas subvibrioides]ADL00462.1 dTDP-4-dehydrorhamnose reductase [Brevundimonas subvibrioides ATCC 15264]
MAEDIVDILVTGGAGQVGRELARTSWPGGVCLYMPTRSELDLGDADAVRALFAATPFKAVINSGAYTAVDKAESEVADAFAANAMGPAILAEVTKAAGIPLVQVSTDYVFDGLGEAHYAESDPVGPLGVYGASKLAGEVAVRTGNPRSVVLRTAWVLSPHRANFLKTMLRLAADRPLVRVVDDQTGSPTSARDIADTLATITLKMIADPEAPTGVYHFVNAGSTTWAGLAREIFTLSAVLGGPSAEVEGITTAQYPTPALRPANSRLSTFKITRDYGVTPRPWQDAVAEIVAELHQEPTP